MAAGTVARMRLWAAAGVALVAAVLGASIALVVGRETGEDAVTTTVTHDALPAPSTRRRSTRLARTEW